MIIVSDTTALSNLLVIDRLNLLQRLYSKIFIPAAVMEELNNLVEFGIDLSEINNADWIEVAHTANKSEVEKLRISIDIGEAEAIVLAKELAADWLLIDEIKGRKIARQEGLNIVGLLGILLKAKHEGLIVSCNDILDDLVGKAGFWISQDLRNKFLQSAGE